MKGRESEMERERWRTARGKETKCVGEDKMEERGEGDGGGIDRAGEQKGS